MFKIAICVFGLLATASSVEAQTVSYGRTPTTNLGGSTGTGGLTQLIATPAFVVNGNGAVTKWEAYNSASVAGIVASVIFTPNPGIPGDYFVIGMDYQTLQPGSNTFLNPAYASSLAGVGIGGSNYVVPGSIFGIFNQTIKISNTQTGAVDNWGRDLDFLTGLPPSGTSLTITTFGITAIDPTVGQGVPRTYSYQVTANVPAPPTLWLVGSVLAGWGISRRKRSTELA